MPRTTRSAKNRPLVDSSDDEVLATLSKPKKRKNIKHVKESTNNLPQQNHTHKQDSSSESDLENYLKPADQIDLTSSFFDVHKKPEENEFQAIENNIFSGINRLSDSESEPEANNEKESNSTVKPSTTGTNKINFQQLHDYTKKLEEAKKVVDRYEARKKAKLAKFKKGKHKKEHQEPSISDLLAKGETKVDSLQDFSKSLHSSDYESFSDSEKEWEEVEEQQLKENKPIVPKEGVQITVQLPDIMRKKKGVDLIASMKRRLNRIRKEHQVYVHKVHLLCWIAHGNYVNTVLNNEHVLALAMSLLPSQHCYPPQRTDLTYLEAVVKWFSNAIPVTDKIISKNLTLDKALHFQINRKHAYNKKMLVYIFICMLRALGIQCRLIFSFIVVPLRPSTEELHTLSTKHNKDKPHTKQESLNNSSTSSSKKSETVKKKDENQKSSSSKRSHTVPNKEKVPSKSSRDTQTSSSSKEKAKRTSKNGKGIVEDKTELKKSAKKSLENGKKEELNQRKTTTHTSKKKETHSENKKCDTNPLNKDKTKPNLKNLNDNKSKSKTKKSTAHKSKVEVPQVDGANDSDSEPPKQIKKPDLKKLTQVEKTSCANKKHPRRLKSLPDYTERDSEDDFKPKVSNKLQVKNTLNLQKLKSRSLTSILPQKNDIRNDIIGIMKGRMAEERAALKTKLVKHKLKGKTTDYDSDYAPESVKKKHDSDDEFYKETKVKVKRRVQVKPEDDKDQVKKKKAVNVWVEVYLESEEQWISVDVSKGEVHCVKQLYSRASHPVTYIVAWNNNNTVKDITQRYCTNWNTVTRKLRIDKRWWEASLKPFTGLKTIRDKEEDEELARMQLDQPLPKTINEYKDHPLYVLKRHLLKFQAIYPPDSITLGFVRDEPVYSRDCVHTLHSRDTWLKHAKVVKLGEKPYKIVKARPKYDKLSGQVITDQPLEVFGKWQVEDYVPPTAKDGIVPRNAYGNVELFKACMLPKGTVHLQLPGLNKVAKKMNIDCVPAVVGFDIHSGWTHPTFDGFIVCEEFSESLIAAWYLEQEEQEKKELEKIEKRVYDNWKKLIRGLLIRERLKARYDYGAPPQDDGSKNKKRKSKGPKLVSKKRRICSESESN